MFRRVIGEEPISGPELDQLYIQLGESRPWIRSDDFQKSAEAVVSATVGAVEGAGRSLARFAEAQSTKAQPPGTVRAGLLRSSTKASYVVASADLARKESGRFLALAGALRPTDPAATRKLVDQVTTLAKANRERIVLESAHAIPFPKLADFAQIGQALLGHNTGPDEVSEVRIRSSSGKDRRAVAIHAFDRAGFHVMAVSASMRAPGDLYVEELQASHGRNCEDLLMALGGGKQPGRGNGALISAGLEALIVEGAKAGLHTISTRPGSPQVQRLYEKMGFTSPGDDRPWKRRLAAWLTEKLPVASGVLNLYTLYRQSALEQRGVDAETMVLDLTNRAAVAQALVGFRLARTTIHDVPKGVAEEMKALGLPAERPRIKQYRREIPGDSSHTRVVTLPAER
jgi:hypothetical protein